MRQRLVCYGETKIIPEARKFTQSFGKVCALLGIDSPIQKTKNSLAYMRQYQENNRGALNKRHAEGRRRRRKLDPEKYRSMGRAERRSQNQRIGFRVRANLRRRLHKSLLGITRDERTLALLGCPVVWLQVHLESQFRSGMTWENYGPAWHIDHIRPCASFDLTNREQQKICFHWTNLQPLFAAENISKGARVK